MRFSSKFSYKTKMGELKTLVLYSAKNNLIEHNVLLLPSGAKEFASPKVLAQEIRAFIHRYADMSPAFEQIAVSYILLSWVYEKYNELPYLRFRGDPGSGENAFAYYYWFALL